MTSSGLMFSLEKRKPTVSNHYSFRNTHIPVSRKSPWPGGAELPKQYWHAHDPLVALTMAASVTKTIKVGTGIDLVTERDPILMAKQAASLDFFIGRALNFWCWGRLE
jgi:alkanesulfonate monooxygenase SsuD/methylene tetrahydromethanopterin reductase-like flavin-dependent oxidoreductase (luciferase family)